MPSATVPKYQDPKIQLLHSKQIQANPFRYVFSSHIACLIACLRACIGGAAYLANETKINIATYPRPRKTGGSGVEHFILFPISDRQ